jgi:hypothetical protein
MGVRAANMAIKTVSYADCSIFVVGMDMKMPAVWHTRPLWRTSHLQPSGTTLIIVANKNKAGISHKALISWCSPTFVICGTSLQHSRLHVNDGEARFT